MEQILPDHNISASDPLAKVASNSSTLIFRTLQYSNTKQSTLYPCYRDKTVRQISQTTHEWHIYE